MAAPGRAVRTLNLAHRELSVVPPDVEAQAADSTGGSGNGVRSNVTRLLLNDNQLSMPPQALDGFPSLRELALDHNRLSMAPPHLAALAHLTDLNLGHNRISMLPREIGQVTSLRSLWVPHADLVTLPEEICQLTALRRLGLHGNSIKALPANIGRLGQLQWLNLSRNNLRRLPASVGDLQSLRTLYADHNRLAGPLPADLLRLAALESLCLRGNRISSVPDRLAGEGTLPRLARLDVRDNALTSLPERLVLGDSVVAVVLVEGNQFAEGAAPVRSRHVESETAEDAQVELAAGRPRTSHGAAKRQAAAQPPPAGPL